MSPILRMPTHEKLPPGPRRDFVEELHVLYRAAGRPQLQKISQLIKENEQLAGATSKETIRRMLRGETIPPSWQTVDAVMTVLCDLAGHTPDLPKRHEDDWELEGLSYAKMLQMKWNEALDSPVFPGFGEKQGGIRHQSTEA